MKLGIISDTHNNLPEDIVLAFRDVDLILHAGDIIGMHILDSLRALAPVEAVYGNADIYSTASLLDAEKILNIENMKIFLKHNIGGIRQFVWNLKKDHYSDKPDVVVFGHTHRAQFEKFEECYFINPGCAGISSPGKPATVAVVEISRGNILNHSLINLLQ